MDLFFFWPLALLRTVTTLFLSFYFQLRGEKGKGFFYQRFLLEKKAWALEESRDDLRKEVLAFEVSSEGELEQASPLIRYFNDKGHSIEIYYASFSAQKKAEELGQEIKGIVRPLPLLNYSLWPSLFGVNLPAFSKAQTLILCRYDFYPELLFWKLLKKKGRVVLISGSLKNKNNEGLANSAFKIMRRWLYGHFDHIICASVQDYQRFCHLGLDRKYLSIFDFRIDQILSRQSHALFTFKQKGPGVVRYTQDLMALKSQQKIILGSFYAEEMEIIGEGPLYEAIVKNEVHICIACHSLKKENLKKVNDILIKKFSEQRVFVLNSNNTVNVPLLGVIVLCEIPGILCELYTSFSYCYVGGGWQRSIHSVLEPYLAHNIVFCGPKIHRSTEFEMAQNNTPQLLISVSHLSEVGPAIMTAQKDQILNLENQKKIEEWALAFDKNKLKERGEDIVRKEF